MRDAELPPPKTRGRPKPSERKENIAMDVIAMILPQVERRESNRYSQCWSGRHSRE